jgi:hypothetical protein
MAKSEKKKRKIATPNQWPLVLIVWKDHTSRDAWDAPADTIKGLVCPTIYSVGWLMQQDAESYSITACASPPEQVACSQRILKGTVAEFKVLAK